MARTAMGGVVEMTEEEMRKKIEELNRQQWEISQRLIDPRGRGGKNFVPSHCGHVCPADRNDFEDQRPFKRRLSSAIVKLAEGEQPKSREDEV